MAKKLDISFKNTEKDLKLYRLLKELEDRSHEIKEVLREFYKEKLEGKELNGDTKKIVNKSVRTEKEESNEFYDLTDF